MSVKKNYPVPANEKQRLKELYDYDILDTLSEKEYDSITKIATQICNVPVSLITFLDKDRQWFKSHLGIDMTEMPREFAFCNYTILDHENVLVVKDMRVDKRFAKNPLVEGEPHAVFYAGAPLITSNGNALGSICVLDAKTNDLTDGQKEALKSLADQVITRLELHKKLSELSQTQEKLKKANRKLKEFSSIASHDMKTPLANISLVSRSFQIRYGETLDEDALGYLALIDRSAKELIMFIDDILINGQKKAGKEEKKIEADSFDIIHKVINLIAPPPDIEINLSGEFPKVQMDKTSLQQVFQNLITNAIKYNDKAKAIIDISCNWDKSYHYFSIADNGTGIDEQNLEKIFQHRQTLEKTDRYGNKGTGIGLSTVKEIIEDNGGKITVDSVKNKGSVFQISIPYISTTLG
ncbi:MAG: ATP-binding protein [Bacteroidota bacterium]|nr:ATP-binding protein [Bacteroidota bacterium]